MNEKINELFPDYKLIEYINNNVIKVDDYIIKKIKRPVNRIYKMLKSKGIDNVLYPLKEFEYQNNFYYVFKCVTYDFDPKETKILDLIYGLKYIHDKTSFKKKISDIEFKRFKRIYKRLDYCFLMLESIVRKSEMSENKTDYDWIILAKYNIYLDCKKELYNLQLKIHNAIKNGLELNYSILNNKPDINHFVNKIFINFSNGKIGYYVSDYCKMYVLNDNIKVSYVEELDRIFNDFDKVYFKFFTLYIYMLNLNFDNSDIFLDNYVNVSKSIKMFMQTFQNYK